MNPNRRTLLTTRGITLVEAAIALAVFALIAVSLMAVTLRVRRMAEQNVYQNTALTMAQGYMEQIRSLPINALVAASASGGALTLTNAAGVVLTDETGGTLQNGEWASETVNLDRNQAGVPMQPLRFRFSTTLTDLIAATSSAAQGTEITILYEVTYNFGSTPLSFKQSVRSVRSHVRTY